MAVTAKMVLDVLAAQLGDVQATLKAAREAIPVIGPEGFSEENSELRGELARIGGNLSALKKYAENTEVK